jgi:hypothetical protein
MMTLELTLAVALLAPAQPDPPTPPPLTGNVTLTNVTTVRQAMDEQIEIMRALMIRKLGVGGGPVIGRPVVTFGATYDPSATGYGTTLVDGPANPYHSQAANRAMPSTGAEGSVEGVYIEGTGVVFAVVMPATGQDPRPGAVGPKSEPILSDWEKEQRRLRGEPIPDQSPKPTYDSVGDVLLKLLADNGKNITGLKDDERVTITVVFRSSGPPQPLAVTENTRFSAGMGTRGFEFGSTAASGPFAEDQALEMLGDLHMKQGEPQQAIDAYRKAVAAAEADSAKNPDAGHKRLHSALLKLASAWLVAGMPDEAARTMDRAKALGATSPQTANRAVRPPPRVATPLPARLTISAPKKLLDQGGSGKMSMDEFRKQATVEYTPGR